MRSMQIVHKSTIECISFQRATRLQRFKGTRAFWHACAAREREIDGMKERRRQNGKGERCTFNVNLTRRRRTERCVHPRARIKEPRIRQGATTKSRGTRGRTRFRGKDPDERVQGKKRMRQGPPHTSKLKTVETRGTSARRPHEIDDCGMPWRHFDVSLRPRGSPPCAKLTWIYI